MALASFPFVELFYIFMFVLTFCVERKKDIFHFFPSLTGAIMAILATG